MQLKTTKSKLTEMIREEYRKLIQERESPIERALFSSQPGSEEWLIENVPTVLGQMGARGNARFASQPVEASRAAFREDSDVRENWRKALDIVLHARIRDGRGIEAEAKSYASLHADPNDPRLIEDPREWGTQKVIELEQALIRLVNKIKVDYPQAYRGMTYRPELKDRVPGEAR